MNNHNGHKKNKDYLNRYSILLFLIITIGTILRFYNYSDRWALAYDQAWFAVIARYAIDTFQIPLLGPFASGGPFQTGGEWFWIVMWGISLFPHHIITPWLFITFLSILQIPLLFLIGKKIFNKDFGLIISLFGAVSPSQVIQSTNLTNQTLISIFSIFSILGIYLYLKKDRVTPLFLTSISIGIASSIHLQGVLLIPLLLVLIAITRTLDLKKYFFCFLGLMIPWIPVLIVDISNSFTNTQNMWFYFLNPNENITYEMINRRWLTFLTHDVPVMWGSTIGGDLIMGYIGIILVFITVFYSFIKKNSSYIVVLLVIYLCATFFILRYIKTPFFDNYIVFLQPFIIFILAYSLFTMYRFKKILLILPILFAFVSIIHTENQIKNSGNFTAFQTKEFVNFLKSKYPGQKIAMYDYEHSYRNKTLPLVYFLQVEGLADHNGVKVGMVIAPLDKQVNFNDHRSIYGEVGEYQLFDLSASEAAALEDAGWINVSPKFVYDSVQNWYKDKE